MSILIDAPRWWFHGRMWSHMISDTSIGELHQFARRNMIRYMSFGLDHYDIPESMLPSMIEAGAEFADSRELVSRLRVADLRRPEGKDARTWRPGSLYGPDGELIVEPDLLSDALRAVDGRDAGRSVVDDVGCFARPNTSVVVVEGDRDPGADWPEQAVVSRYRDRWAIEFVVGEF